MPGASCVLLDCDDPVWPALRRISDLGIAEHSAKHTLDSFEVNVANAPLLYRRAKTTMLNDLVRPIVGPQTKPSNSAATHSAVRLDPNLGR